MTEDLRTLPFELEQAQCELSRKNGFLPTFIDNPWTPIPRIKATESEVDALVEEAESELDGRVSVKVKVSTKKKRGEKLENATKIFKQMKNKSRKEVIAVYVNKLGMSPAMASTYFQSIRSKA